MIERLVTASLRKSSVGGPQRVGTGCKGVCAPRECSSMGSTAENELRNQAGNATHSVGIRRFLHPPQCSLSDLSFGRGGRDGVPQHGLPLPKAGLTTASTECLAGPQQRLTPSP